MAISQEKLKKLLEAEKEEMLKHKWIESEKAGYDLGEAALIDWIKKYAASFRAWWESVYKEEE